jgi:trehalose 6-phosphate phosphatase
VRLLDRLDRELGDGAGLIAILDYDGTLTPLVSSPGAASLAPSVRANLARLAGSERVRLGILSGRGLTDLRARVALDNVVYGGCHGLEIAGPRLRFRHPRARRADVAATERALAAALASVPGAFLECKGLVVSLHYRHVVPARRPAVREIAERVLSRRPDLSLIAGHLVFDFMPRVGWHKGTAARWMVSRLARTLPARRAVIVYIGDDASDEMAFAALRGRALTIHVGSRKTAAEYRVRGVRDVQALLHRMVAALGS